VNTNKIMNSTMAVFYRELKENSVFRGMHFVLTLALLETLVKADEFSTLISLNDEDNTYLDQVFYEI
jgi:hypothetical protein